MNQNLSERHDDLCNCASNAVEFDLYGSVHRKSIFKYNQRNATLHSYLFLWNALHVSGGSSAHHQEFKNCMYSIGYCVKPLLLPATVLEEMGLWNISTIITYICTASYDFLSLS